MASQMRWLEALPSEVWLIHILANLPVEYLFSFASCNRYTHALVMQEQLWKRMVVMHFHASPSSTPSPFQSWRSLYRAIRRGIITFTRGNNIAVNDYGTIITGCDGQAYTKTLTVHHGHQFRLLFRAPSSSPSPSPSSPSLTCPSLLERPTSRGTRGTVIVGVGPSLSRVGRRDGDDDDDDDDDGCFCLTDCRRNHDHCFEYVDIPDCDISDSVTITITSITLVSQSPPSHQPFSRKRKRGHDLEFKTLTAQIRVDRDGEVVGHVGMTFPTEGYGRYLIKGLRLVIGLRPNNNSQIQLQYLPLP